MTHFSGTILQTSPTHFQINRPYLKKMISYDIKYVIYTLCRGFLIETGRPVDRQGKWFMFKAVKQWVSNIFFILN